eukprot:scaffold28398_cov28-Tisochrysis_lutea.AAC.2
MRKATAARTAPSAPSTSPLPKESGSRFKCVAREPPPYTGSGRGPRYRRMRIDAAGVAVIFSRAYVRMLGFLQPSPTAQHPHRWIGLLVHLGVARRGQRGRPSSA